MCVVSNLPRDRAIVARRLPAWYALHVKRNNEHRVVERLTLKSVQTFLPLIESVRSRRRRHGAPLDPLFPGYLFVRMGGVEESPGRWHAVQWTPGVRLILGTDGIPVPILGGVVEGIQERVREYGFVRRGIPFQPRARVRFGTGPMSGLEALFEHPMSGSGRVRVLMSLLGRQTGIEVDALDLEDA